MATSTVVDHKYRRSRRVCAPNRPHLVKLTGLVLSPAFDTNPNPHKRHLSLAIDQVDGSLNLGGGY